MSNQLARSPIAGRQSAACYWRGIAFTVRPCRRYLFNVGEGLQRSSTQHHIKLKPVTHVFCTSLRASSTPASYCVVPGLAIDGIASATSDRLYIASRTVSTRVCLSARLAYTTHAFAAAAAAAAVGRLVFVCAFCRFVCLFCCFCRSCCFVVFVGVYVLLHAARRTCIFAGCTGYRYIYLHQCTLMYAHDGTRRTLVAVRTSHCIVATGGGGPPGLRLGVL